MPPLTDEQVKGIVSDMVDAGFNESEIDDTLRGQGVNRTPQRFMDQPAGQQGLSFVQSMAPLAGAVTGGVAVPALAEKYIPQAALKYVPHAVQTGVGVGLGTTAGNLVVDPTHPKEALKQGVNAGLFAGGTEGLLNLLTRALGSMGGVQGPAVSQALSKGTGARTVFSKPATTAEAELGGRINAALEPKNTGLTPGRLSTQAQLSQLQSAGGKVDMTPTMQALDEHINQLQSGGIGGDARVALGKLTRLRDDIQSKYLNSYPSTSPPKIAVTPQEADYINQQMQDAIGNAYGRAGAKEATRALKGVAATHTASFRAQTGTAESAAITKARLDAIESMRKQITATSPESFVRGVGNALMTEGESGDQSALMALREFDPSGQLEAQIKDLASRREWTGSQSRIAHNIKFEFVRRLPRFAAKLTTVATRSAGVGVGAVSAFEQAMDPRNNP